MDADLCSFMGVDPTMGVNPRDLQLDLNVYHDPDIFTSFHASQTELSNGIPPGGDSFPRVPASTRPSTPTALAGPNMEMGAFDGDMSAFGGDFGIDEGVGIPGKYTKTEKWN
jgi:hypothetical protein